MIRITLIAFAIVVALTLIGVSAGAMISEAAIAAGGKCERTTLSIHCQIEW